jgi:hypothetical protein
LLVSQVTIVREVLSIGHGGGLEERMDVLGIFRRGGIGTADALADYLDQQALLQAKAAVDEYTRARAGTAGEELFADAAFARALERAQWEAYPLVLTMLAEMVVGVLRPHAQADETEMLRALQGLVLAVFDRHGVPAALTPPAWATLRGEIFRWLGDLQERPPKQAADIAEPFAPSILAVMPIHDLLRAENFPALRNDLRVSVSRAHEDFARRARGRALVAALLGRR